MKKISLSSILLLCALLCSAQNYVLKADLVSPISDKVKFAFERSFVHKFSAQLTFQSGPLATGAVNGDEVYRLSGSGIIPEVRYYPFSKRLTAPLGFFCGIAFRYFRFTEKYEDMSYSATSKGVITNAGLDIGYKFRYRRVCLEVLGGAGIGSVKNDDDISAYRIPSLFTKLREDEKNFIRAEVSFGYIFPRISDNR